MTIVSFPRPRTSRLRRPPPSTILVVVLVAGALAAVSVLRTEPRFVAQVSFVNPTPFDLGIDVTGAGRGAWMGVGYAAKDTTSSTHEVFDIGDVWIFRFAAQGEDGGELRMTRLELERNRWTVRVPASVGARLAAEGTPPTP
jgi:hypothetical protein